MTHVIIRSKVTNPECQHNFHVGDRVTECDGLEAIIYIDVAPEAILFRRTDGLRQLLEKEDYQLEETNG